MRNIKIGATAGVIITITFGVYIVNPPMGTLMMAVEALIGSFVLAEALVVE